MFEGRLREYRQGLIDGVAPHLRAGEQVETLALAQMRVPPWVQFSAYGIGAVGLLGGFIAGLMPAWLAIALIVIGIAGAVAATRIPRRMLVRTGQRLYVFAIPATSKAEVGEPISAYELDQLPTGAPGDPPMLDGVRAYPNFGASGEQEAIAEALA